jgi:hypothetical protein
MKRNSEGASRKRGFEEVRVKWRYKDEVERVGEEKNRAAKRNKTSSS